MSNKLIQHVISAEDFLAKRFHYTYEALAPQFNYETRKASAKPWEEIPENNRKLMIAVSEGVLTFLCSCEGIARENQLPQGVTEKEWELVKQSPKCSECGHALVLHAYNGGGDGCEIEDCDCRI